MLAATTGDDRIKTLVLSELEETQGGGQDKIIGSIRNEGASVVKGIGLEANLFKGEKFVDQYTTYLSGSLGPGESRHFKISCGCKDGQAAEHDSFKVVATKAY